MAFKFQKLDTDVVKEYFQLVGHQAGVAKGAFEALGEMAKAHGEVNVKFQENIGEAIKFSQKAYESAASAEQRAEIRGDVRDYVGKADKGASTSTAFLVGLGLVLGAAVVGLGVLIAGGLGGQAPSGPAPKLPRRS